MIKPGEIQVLAGEAGVRDTQIEKDYAISWGLFGISQNEFLSNCLAFKGGTALKKIYYPDYRFSEDLDFTYVGSEFNIDTIKAEFQKMIEQVYAESRIQFSIKNDLQYETGNYNFYLAYTGPLGGFGANKDIKVDISTDELMCDSPTKRNIINRYSDLEGIKYKVLVYTLSEIISEKMRSLMQRTAPRDIYDLWYLFEQEGLNIQDYISSFKKKAEHKKKNPPELTKVVMHKEKIFQSHWEKHLASQMNDIPDFKKVWRELGKHWRKFEKLIG